MKHKIAVMLIMIMTLMMIFSSFAYAADNSVGIKIEFDKTAYVKGETATATLTLTGMSNEKQNNTKISAFETHLKFGLNNLTYIKDKSKSGFDTNLFNDTEDGIEKVFQVTQNYNDVIVIAFSYDSGISLENKVNDSGELKIGTVAFTINDNVNNRIEIGFDEIGFNGGSYVTELADETIERINITVPTVNSTAKIKNVIAETSPATFANNTVTGSINIRLSKDQSAVLIAQLYDTATGLTKGTVVEPIEKSEISAVSKKFNIEFNNIPSKDNLVVRYYLWESFANMKALTTIQPTPIK